MAANELDPAQGSVIPDTDFDTYDRTQLAVLVSGLAAAAASTWTVQAVRTACVGIPYLLRALLRARRG